MIDQLRQHYPQSVTNNCIEDLTEAEFGVFDDEASRSVIVRDLAQRHNFKVNNSNRRNISFIAIDKCVFSTSDPFQRCDFGLVCGSQICFVEIKDIIKYKGKRVIAILQLKSTIEVFKGNIDFSDFQLEAIICKRYKDPAPAASTALQDWKLIFKRDLNADLMEGNQKVFI